MRLSHLCSVMALAAAMASGTSLAASTTHDNGSTMSGRECRKAFFAAKKDGSLNGMDYKAFKASKCATGSVATHEEAKSSDDKTTASVAPVVAGSVVFPDKIDAQFASLPPGKGRMKTCVAQYNANKEKGGNGSLKWIQKGGGYWSQCNAHLKGTQPK